MKSQATYQEKISAKHLSHRGLLSKIYKELLKINNKKIDNSIKNCIKVLDRYFTEEYIQMANKLIKRCSTSYIIREFHIK